MTEREKWLAMLQVSLDAGHADSALAAAYALSFVDAVGISHRPVVISRGGVVKTVRKDIDWN